MSSTTPRQRLLQELAALPDEARLIAGAVSLFDVSVSARELNSVLQRYQVVRPGGGSWSEKVLRALQRNHAFLQYALPEGSASFSLPPAYRWPAFQVGLADFPRLSELARGIMPKARLTRGRPKKDYDQLLQRTVLALAANDAETHVEAYLALTEPPDDWSPPSRSQDRANRQYLEFTSLIHAPFWWSRSGALQRLMALNVCAELTVDDAAGLLPQLDDYLANPQWFFNMTMAEVPLDHLGIVFLERHVDNEFARDYSPALDGVMYLVRGADAGAEETFQDAPDAEDSVTLCDLIRLLYRYDRGRISLKDCNNISSRWSRSTVPVAVAAYRTFLNYENGDRQLVGEQLRGLLPEAEDHPFNLLMICWVARWTATPLPPEAIATARAAVVASEGLGVTPWLRAELLIALGDADNPWARPYLATQGFRSLSDLIEPKEEWQTFLSNLDNLGPRGRAPDQPQGNERLVWIVTPNDIYPKEQKRRKNNSWTPGRRLSAEQFSSERFAAPMLPQEKAVLRAMQEGGYHSSSWYYDSYYSFPDRSHLLYLLADHPHLYLGESKRTPLEVSRGQATLTVQQENDRVHVAFDPPYTGEEYVVRPETPTRYTATRLDETARELAKSIGSGVRVPAEHRQRLEQRLTELAGESVQLQTDAEILAGDLEELPGDPKTCVHLLPDEEGYLVNFYTKPVPDQELYFKPGDGLPRSVVDTPEGRRLLVRDQAAEIAGADETHQAIQLLTDRDHVAYEWRVPDQQEALGVLYDLRELLNREAITVEYPRGQKLKLSGVATEDQLGLRISSGRDWFEVDGGLQLDEQTVLGLQFILEQLSDTTDRFVRLGDNDFVAMTDDLRQRLAEMDGLLNKRGKNLRLNTLAAGRFSEVAEGLEDVEADRHWAESLERIDRARRAKPRVPDTFRAELRDYQAEGFRWMMRLAAWGVGGCLADDMGLGKTVQALAVLDARADGPSLVLAPASVTRNWRREAERFAPALNPILLASRNQTDVLKNLKGGDLVLVSYGLLPFIDEELTEVAWTNVVLDEAQAIKNSATKRARAVQKLNADFKLATTGTPIENHLGELWSLFRFLNPGLLGSMEVFNQKFNYPISRYDDKARRDQLRKLVSPFILRRRKDQVLKELPPKTEIVLDVELSPEELALYEAMRRQALKEIAEAAPEEKRFKILAQLTRLRQMACHPKLVQPKSKVPSAKLALVGETITELLENGHRALIFSQFVKHLRLVEEWVKSEGIGYQYLDGSTPGKAREQRVNAFQAGEGEVFLISLKAGGTGLNLTAADYILHLDPWWNPAAEDQASDRAHRIGQQKPVTVYRFVSQHTIEEQIIALHQEKRDLADQILEGTGRAGALSVDEILDLLKQD